MLRSKKSRGDFDARHWAWPLADIPVDSEVWVISDGANPLRGRVSGQSGNPRSYNVSMDASQVRRNRCHLSVIPEGDQGATI